MNIEHDWLNEPERRPKCRCGEPLVVIQAATFDYTALHQTKANVKCERRVTFAIKPSGSSGSHVTVNPCPGCEQPNATFLAQGGGVVEELACPKGCRAAIAYAPRA